MDDIEYNGDIPMTPITPNIIHNNFDFSKNFQSFSLGYNNVGMMGKLKENDPNLRKDKELRGCYIDRKKVKFTQKNALYSGSYGKIIRGVLNVGSDSLQIAVKVLNIDGVVTKNCVIREITTQYQLFHENVVKCYGGWFSTNYKKAYICVEFVKGGDLEAYIQKNPQLHCQQKLSIILQIARAMKYIHANGFVYRDLKCKNVLISEDGKCVKICDFGECKKEQSIGGTLCGTPDYLAPEQLLGSRSDNPKLIDVYSFGIMIWQLWTGKQPYMDLYRKHIRSMFNFLKEIHGISTGKIIRPNINDENLQDCPAELKCLVSCCWDQNPENRPISFDSIVKKIEKLQNDYDQS